MPDRDTFLEELAHQFDLLMERMEEAEVEEPDFRGLGEMIEQVRDEIENLQG